MFNMISWIHLQFIEYMSIQNNLTLALLLIVLEPQQFMTSILVMWHCWYRIQTKFITFWCSRVRYYSTSPTFFCKTRRKSSTEACIQKKADWKSLFLLDRCYSTFSISKPKKTVTCRNSTVNGKNKLIEQMFLLEDRHCCHSISMHY